MASVDSGSTWGFTYDAMGDRVQWSNSGGTNQALFDPSGGWLGMAGVYSLVRWGAGYLVVYRGSETSFVHINHLSSTTMMTGHSGSALEDMLFYPWGDVWQSWGGGGYNFAEMPYYDTTTDTNITPFRFQSPNLGRWLSPDPMGGDITNPQSLDRYAYVMNNPTTLTDPLGLTSSICLSPNYIMCNTNPWGNVSMGPYGFPSCTLDGVEAPCSVVDSILSAGAGCIGSCTTTVTGPNGLPYQIVQTAGPPVYLGPNGEELSPESADEEGLPALPDEGPLVISPGSGTTGGAGGGAGGGTGGCTARILGVANQTLGTSFTSANVQGSPSRIGGAINISITAGNLPAAQFNAIVPGRYVSGPLQYLVGYGPSLHITGAGFKNNNVGGFTSVTFTAHIDSAYAYNPIGFVLHEAIDVLGPNSRNPCP